MRKLWVAVLVIGALVLGTGVAFGAFTLGNQVLQRNLNRQSKTQQGNLRGLGFGPQQNQGRNQRDGQWDNRRQNIPQGPGQGFEGRMGPGGMMNPGYGLNQNGRNFGPGGRMGQNGQVPANAQRITQDAAVEAANKAIASDTNLKVTEVMEFENNFYIVVAEKDSGHAAMELLVDPYTSHVILERGPEMMWNLKYGNMRANSTSTDSTLTADAMKAAAQKYLDANVAVATVKDAGIAFYGYTTFDYVKDGKVVGMLSVNGLDGKVWLHTWHGAFISEKEIQ